jgi:hypothetical protein
MISPIRKIYSLKEKASNSKELEAFLNDYKAVFNTLVDQLGQMALPSVYSAG